MKVTLQYIDGEKHDIEIPQPFPLLRHRETFFVLHDYVIGFATAEAEREPPLYMQTEPIDVPWASQ